MKPKGNTRTRGVTVIITRSLSGKWFCDAYGPTGAALAHQPAHEYRSIESAARAARNTFGTALDSIRVWSPDTGYSEVPE